MFPYHYISTSAQGKWLGKAEDNGKSSDKLFEAVHRVSQVAKFLVVSVFFWKFCLQIGLQLGQLQYHPIRQWNKMPGKTSTTVHLQKLTFKSECGITLHLLLEGPFYAIKNWPYIHLKSRMTQHLWNLQAGCTVLATELMEHPTLYNVGHPLIGDVFFSFLLEVSVTNWTAQ